MHEFSLVQQIIECALQTADDHGSLPIARVCVEIGALQQVVPEALVFAFEAAVKDTPAQGAVLDWKEIPARVVCSTCNACFEPEDLFWTCPQCNSIGGRVIQGDELILKSVELLDPEEAEEPV